MSGLLSSRVGGQLRYAVGSGVEAVRRTTRTALLLRCLVWVAGVAGLVLAIPPAYRDVLPLLVAVALLAAVPAVAPGWWLVLAVELLVVAGWLLRTTVLGVPVTCLPLVVMAVALYVHHSASALAASLPLNVRVLPGVLRGWLLRCGLVLGVTAVLAAVALPVGNVVGDAGTVAVPVVGVLLAVLVAGLLAYGLKRRD